MLGWDLIEVLHRGGRSSVYRAERVGGGALLVLKMTSDPKRPQAMLSREHQVLEALRGCEGVIACHGLERDRSQLGLVLEHVPGKPLNAVATVATLPLAQVLSTMLELLSILEHVHGRGFVHADLSPLNVLLAADGQMRLLDFASAVSLGSEASQSPPWSHQRLIAYAAPEQLGRIKRRIDQRSDFYSFGAMLFEAVTGRLPFLGANPLELAHAHVARSPRNPSELAPDVSPALASVILKLLAKDPDARYQSAGRLRQDLLACREAVIRQLSSFDGLAPGAEQELLRIPDKLYGRDAVLARLEDAVDRAFRGRNTVIGLEGPAGIGKTALASALRRCVNQRKGMFFCGKFEVDQDSHPMKPLRDALSQLAEQLSKSGERALHTLTDRLERRLPGATRALLSFAPELSPVLSGQLGDEAERSGSVDPVPRAAGELLRLVSGHGHPVCLFVDDVQWATASDLRWMKEVIATAQLGTLVVILASRLNETGAEATYRGLLSELSDQGFTVIAQPLESLTARDIRPMLRETFDIGNGKLEALLEIVLPRSAGNPLFLRTILQSVHRDCAVRSVAGPLDLDLARVHALDPGDDVIELLSRYARTLPPATTLALKYAACLGRDFDVGVLSALVPGNIPELLEPATQVGLLAPAPAFGVSSSYHFAHDRALQAVVAQLEEREALDIHRRIGELLLAECAASGPTPSFATLAHLNRAAPVLSAHQLVELAGFNVVAARMAIQRGHGELALGLTRHGIQALGERGWEEHDALMRALYLAQAEAAFGWAEHELLTESCASLRAHEGSAYDRVDVLVLEGRLQQSQQKSGEAIRIYLRALHELDVELPLVPEIELVDRELKMTADILHGRSADSLMSLDACGDKHVARVVELLSKLVFFSYSASNSLLTVAACRIVRFAITHGHTPDSANGFAFYGLSVVGDHDLERAVHFARIAMELAEQSGSAAVLSSAHLYSNYLLMHWKVPLKKLSGAFLKAYHYGLQAGSPSNASASATTLCICQFWSGNDLPKLFAEMEEYRAQLVRFKQRMVLNWHEILMQLVHNLREPSVAPSVFAGPFYNESVRVPGHIQASEAGTLFNFYIAKATICLLFDDIEGAVAAVEANVPIAPQCASSMWAIPYVYLDSLCRLEACLHGEESARDHHLQRVDANLQKLRAWASHNPAEVEHRLRIIEAQRARVGGRDEHARHLFGEATELARHVGPHDEALICELAARFWFQQGDLREGRACLRRAHRAYLLWGAVAKARWLEQRYAAELAPATWRATDTDATHAPAHEMDALDLVGVLAASRAIASEIRLDSLLRRLMGLVIETAGAEVGYLLLPDAGEWVVEAGRNADGSDFATLTSVRVSDLPKHGGRALRIDALDAVNRTAQPVLLSADSGPLPERSALAADVGSILCFPFKRQGKTEAIAYLENRLAPSVFTRASIAVLEVLSGQAVIALQNARLYQDLEQKVQQRTLELRTKNQDLEGAMAQLIELQQQLVMKEKLAAVGALTANIAHEIKNPLNFVTNFSELALGLAADTHSHVAGTGDRVLVGLIEQIEMAAQKVADHGRRAAAIVDSMSLHSPRAPALLKPTDLNALVHTHAHLAPGAYGDLAASIRLKLAPELVQVPLVADAMGRVIVNLISNACHSLQAKRAACGEGFMPEIVVTTREQPDHVELCVRDNGVGIAPELRDKVFLPFFTSKTNGAGTGLGLSISHDIVVRGHRGSISLESEPGEFAAFSVRLPR